VLKLAAGVPVSIFTALILWQLDPVLRPGSAERMTYQIGMLALMLLAIEGLNRYVSSVVRWVRRGSQAD
jgi:hypothetical protein